MTREQAAADVKARYSEYLKPAKKRVSGRTSYICPLCGNGTGTDGDGMTIDPHGDGTQLKCFKCGFYGDIVDLYQREHGGSIGEAFRALYDRFGITIDREATREAQRAFQPKGDKKPALDDMTATEGAEAVKQYMDYYKRCMQHITDPAAVDYLTFRGISAETAHYCNMGYDPDTGYIIIPCSRGYYVARNTDREAKQRYNNPAGAKVELFRKSALYKSGQPVFVTEGAINAISIIEAGGEAIALNSASNTRLLLETLKKKPTKATLIICLDDDPAGQAATQRLIEGLQELNTRFIVANVNNGQKDQNDALKADRAAFSETIAATERKTTRPDNTRDYIAQIMAGEVDRLKADAGRITGFTNLDDEAGSIYSGLYIIGGISSVGKTTFLAQMADQMAARGQHVLYFSLEQSRLEMVSKSIARQTAINDIRRAVTSLQIRLGASGESIKRGFNEYLASVGDRISVIEGNFNCNTEFISDYVKAYIQQNGARPVVMVDYLQILQPITDPETGRKPTDPRQITDANITALKRMSRNLELPVFIISSLNRSNYLTPIDFESFKESGGVEYGADVIYGLQLKAIHGDTFNGDGNIAKKREAIAKAKEADPREIELVCLKNRYGKSRYNCYFKYYPAYDYFRPCDENGHEYGDGDFKPLTE